MLSTFIKPPFSIKTLVLSIFKWPLKTGFAVLILTVTGPGLSKASHETSMSLLFKSF